ncbi:serine/threonine/tyrosine-interacting protein B-like [Ruditapes philippinarum]|uniref:serine/threonine/tyrosine-interacting protein B-like n=1 Tax=Ruditapes philippinarum TaxID=129788 RepID=UPI00295B87AE|nr:serine/threonine/tyrosine-interacting protein B-like [Ruditapes philippinarum]
MRRDMQEIIPGLYLGPYAAAMKSKKMSLQDHNITHIVCIRQAIEANFIRPNFPDLFIGIFFGKKPKPGPSGFRMRDFIDGCYECGGKVLVHGNAGISRSAALVIGYIMEKYGLTYKNAYVYVQQRRFCINPNEGFSQQLMEYEPIYRARQCVEFTDNTSTGSLKRKYQVDSDETLHSESSSMIT